MTAFFVSRITVSDPAKLQTYAQAAGPTISAYGGKLALRGVYARTLIGEDQGKHVTSVVEFPDITALETWFNSPEYQAHSPLRESVGEMQFVAYEAPPA